MKVDRQGNVSADCFTHGCKFLYCSVNTGRRLYPIHGGNNSELERCVAASYQRARLSRELFSGITTHVRIHPRFFSHGPAK
ncbi:hypothetical protein EDF71_13113 [Comamonas sp. JUb58]|nr:hypothetical protein EDF71_13113 [Comamonas sp. JUb58]